MTANHSGLRAWILRLTIQAGDVEIDLEGAAIQIDEQVLQALSLIHI